MLALPLQDHRIAFGIALARNHSRWRRATLEVSSDGLTAELWWPSHDEWESRWMCDTFDLRIRRHDSFDPAPTLSAAIAYFNLEIAEAFGGRAGI